MAYLKIDMTGVHRCLNGTWWKYTVLKYYSLKVIQFFFFMTKAECITHIGTKRSTEVIKKKKQTNKTPRVEEK